MTISDQIILYHLANKYDMTADIDDVLARADEITQEDMATLGQILSRLPPQDIRQCISHPAFDRVLARFIDLADMPRLQAKAFLKTGVPIRRIVLPRTARDQLNVEVTRWRGYLCANGRPIRLTNLTYAQARALRQANVPKRPV